MYNFVFYDNIFESITNEMDILECKVHLDN